MACGTIVLTSNTTFKQIIGNDFIFEKNNLEQLTDKILKLINLEANKKEFIQESLRREANMNHDLKSLVIKVIKEFNNKSINICYFGTYDPIYTRNRLMIKGLKENGVNVIECHTPQTSNKLKKYWALIKKHQQIKKDYDIMVVGFAGHAIIPLAWLLAKLNRKKVILDLFVSEYDSVILDRKQHSPRSLTAFKLWLMDWLSCRLADLCLLDAEEHNKYMSQAYKVKPEKFKMVFVSCDQNIFYPREKKQNSDKYIIHYHGSYSPIQGVPYIIKAAKILKNENIQFNIIGKLKHHKPEIALAKDLGLQNINFIDAMPYEQLSEQMTQADLILGMFGDTDKAMHCSAFKIIEGMAIKKPVLTGDTPALHELSPNNSETCYFCNMADSQDLADKILILKNNPDLSNKIAENGYKFCLEYLTPKATAKELINIINNLK